MDRSPAISVRVFEDAPHLAVRVGVGALAVACLLVGIFARSIFVHPSRGIDFTLVACALVVGGRYLPLRRMGGVRSATLAPGLVRLSGPLPGRIRSSDVLGATFLESEGRVDVLLTQKRRGTIRIALDAKDLSALARALDLGRLGAGEVNLAGGPRLVDYLEFGFRMTVAAGFLVPVMIHRLPDWYPAIVGVETLAMLIVVALSRILAKSRLSISPETLTVRTADKWEGLARADIASAAMVNSELVIARRNRPPVRVALRRSRTLGIGVDAELGVRIARALPQASTTRVVETLARGDEPSREWLARLDRMGAEGNDAYRGSALTDAELWAALESPDYDVDVRAAAARVLRRRAPDALSIRIAPVLEAIGDPEVRKRVSSVISEDTSGEDADESSPIPRARA